MKSIREYLLEKNENEDKWWLKERPSIFKETTYRFPTDEELEEFKNYPNLTPDDIMNGFNYTLVGKGMLDDITFQKIKKCVEMLIDKYPDNTKYKEALELVKNDLSKRIRYERSKG